MELNTSKYWQEKQCSCSKRLDIEVEVHFPTRTLNMQPATVNWIRLKHSHVLYGLVKDLYPVGKPYKVMVK